MLYPLLWLAGILVLLVGLFELLAAESWQGLNERVGSLGARLGKRQPSDEVTPPVENQSMDGWKES